jgi:hypothetical protein
MPDVGRTDKTKKTKSLGQRRKRSRMLRPSACLHHDGACVVRIGTQGRWRAVGSRLRSACYLAARAVGEAKMALSGLGVVRACRRLTRTLAHSRAAARQRREARLSGSVDDAGLLIGASNRSSVPIIRVLGLVSNGVLRSPAAIRGRRWCRQRAAWRLIRQGRGLFHQSCRAALIRTFWSPDGFAENGRSVSRLMGSDFATVGVTTRRLTGGSNAVALASISSRAGSVDRQSNTQMEPTRPTVLCDPVTAARGSFAPLGG